MSQAAGEEEKDKQLARMTGQLGLHRGRRLLAFLLLLGVLAGGSRGLGAWSTGGHDSHSPPPTAEVAVEPAPVAKPAPAVRSPARKRTAKARGATRPASPGAPESAAQATIAGRPASPADPEPAVIAERRVSPATPEPAAVEPVHAAPPLPIAERHVSPIASEPELLELLEPGHAAPEVPPAEEPSSAAAGEPGLLAPDEPANPEGNGELIARRIAEEKRAEIQACFERELRKTPKLRGNVMVELDLAPSQRVDGVRVIDDLDRPAFTQCVSTTMHDLTFLALNEEVSIQLPFILTAR